MDAEEALADLKQISVQIAHAVVARADGTVEASTLADAPSGERVARAAVGALGGGRPRAQRPRPRRSSRSSRWRRRRAASSSCGRRGALIVATTRPIPRSG